MSQDVRVRRIQRMTTYPPRNWIPFNKYISNLNINSHYPLFFKSNGCQWEMKKRLITDLFAQTETYFHSNQVNNNLWGKKTTEGTRVIKDASINAGIFISQKFKKIKLSWSTKFNKRATSSLFFFLIHISLKPRLFNSLHHEGYLQRFREILFSTPVWPDNCQWLLLKIDDYMHRFTIFFANPFTRVSSTMLSNKIIK